MGAIKATRVSHGTQARSRPSLHPIDGEKPPRNGAVIVWSSASRRFELPPANYRLSSSGAGGGTSTARLNSISHLELPFR